MIGVWLCHPFKHALHVILLYLMVWLTCPPMYGPLLPNLVSISIVPSRHVMSQPILELFTMEWFLHMSCHNPLWNSYYGMISTHMSCHNPFLGLFTMEWFLHMFTAISFLFNCDTSKSIVCWSHPNSTQQMCLYYYIQKKMSSIQVGLTWDRVKYLCHGCCQLLLSV